MNLIQNAVLVPKDEMKNMIENWTYQFFRQPVQFILILSGDRSRVQFRPGTPSLEWAFARTNLIDEKQKETCVKENWIPIPVMAEILRAFYPELPDGPVSAVPAVNAVIFLHRQDSEKQDERWGDTGDVRRFRISRRYANGVHTYALTDAEARNLYTEMQRRYDEADAQAHLRDWMEEQEEPVKSWNDTTVKAVSIRMASWFRKNHDCNISENDLWTQAINECV